MSRYVIVVAGGSGLRMKADQPKQFLKLDGIPILIRTLTKFKLAVSHIKTIVVLPVGYSEIWENYCLENEFTFRHIVCEGGETRFHSVKNGLQHITSPGIVGIHDGVRPLITPDLIERLYSHADIHGNAVPAIELNESIRRIDDQGNYPVPRRSYKAIQTPQCFHSNVLKEAYNQAYTEDFTDDATVVEKLGVKINLVEGEINNIKITTQQDLLIAKALI